MPRRTGRLASRPRYICKDDQEELLKFTQYMMDKAVMDPKELAEKYKDYLSGKDLELKKEQK